MPSFQSSKVLLSDVLGAIVSSMAQARLIADISTINMAYVYQRTELLQGMAVPRLRFRGIEVDIPVLIKEVQKVREATLDTAVDIARRVVNEVIRRAALAKDKMEYDARLEDLNAEKRNIYQQFAVFWKHVCGLDEQQINDFVELVKEQMQSRVFQYLKLRDCTSVSFESSVRNEIGLAARIGVVQRLYAIYNVYTEAEVPVIDNLNEKFTYNQLMQHSSYKKITQAASTIAADTCIILPNGANDLELEVCTDEVKNAGGAITRLKFSLREEGMEWVMDEGGNRLVVE